MSSDLRFLPGVDYAPFLQRYGLKWGSLLPFAPIAVPTINVGDATPLVSAPVGGRGLVGAIIPAAGPGFLQTFKIRTTAPGGMIIEGFQSDVTSLNPVGVYRGPETPLGPTLRAIPYGAVGIIDVGDIPLRAEIAGGPGEQITIPTVPQIAAMPSNLWNPVTWHVPQGESFIVQGDNSSSLLVAMSIRERQGAPPRA